MEGRIWTSCASRAGGLTWYQSDTIFLRAVMPKKIRELVSLLSKAGFVDRGGKGSHRNFLHPKGVRVTISGAMGDDAKPYQEKEVTRCIEEVEG